MNVIKSEGRKERGNTQDYCDLTYTLGLEAEIEVELSSALNFCRTINHKGQKTLHETAGEKKKKQRTEA